MNSTLVRLVLVATAGYSSAAAQKVPLQDGSGAMIQIVRIAGIVPTEKSDDALVLAAPVVPAGRGAPSTTLSELAAFARDFVTPPLANGEDIQPLGTERLAVLGRQEQCAWVERLAASQQRASGILVQLRTVMLPEALMQRLEKDLGLAERSSKQEPVVIDDPKVEDLVEAVVKDPAATLVSAPQLLTKPLQPATIAVGNNISYIKDFEIEVGKAGEKIADPVIGTVFSGVRLGVVAGLLGDKEIGVSIEYTMADVKRPIPRFQTTLGAGEPITIELPSATITRLRHKAVMPDGKLAIMRAPRVKDSHPVVLLRVTTQK